MIAVIGLSKNEFLSLNIALTVSICLPPSSAFPLTLLSLGFLSFLCKYPSFYT